MSFRIIPENLCPFHFHGTFSRGFVKQKKKGRRRIVVLTVEDMVCVVMSEGGRAQKSAHENVKNRPHSVFIRFFFFSLFNFISPF